jgi:hypothetical protein
MGSPLSLFGDTVPYILAKQFVCIFKIHALLELAQEYSQELLIFVKKYGKQQKRFLGQVTF